MKDAGAEKASDILKRMADDTRVVADHCLARHRSETVLKSLLFDEIVERHSDIPSAHKDTFQWALKDEKTNLAHWLKNENGIYWIRGKAGSGKSTLMKYLELEPETQALLRTWADERPLVMASHYFWAIGTKLQRNLKGLLQTLLFRILIQDPDLLPQICPDRVDSYSHIAPWTLNDLKRSFNRLSTIEKLPSKLCLFVDGLDEFEGDRQELIDIIKATASSHDIKFCVSSRPWQMFEKAFGTNSWKLSVHELTRLDIQMYAQDKLSTNSRYQELRKDAPDDAHSLLKEITEAADSVFFWVYLVTRELLEGLEECDENIIELRSRLTTIPSDLDAYFTRMLLAIDPEYHKETSIIFAMLICAGGFISTKITWAQRCYVQRLPSPESGLLWTAYEDGNLDFLASFWPTEEWKHESAGMPEEYSPTAEGKKVATVCKDLVYVPQGRPDESKNPSELYELRVGFLHRTVADFLVLDSAKAIIDERFGCNPGICEGSHLRLEGLRGLANARLYFLWSLTWQSAGPFNPLDEIMKNSNEVFLHALLSAKALEGISSADKGLVLFQIWSFFYFDCIFNNDLRRLESRLLKDGLFHSGQSRLDELWDAHLFGIHHFLVEAMDSGFAGSHRHSEHVRCLESLSASVGRRSGGLVQATYWHLTCKYCWSKSAAKKHPHEALISVMSIYFGRWKAASPSERGFTAEESMDGSGLWATRPDNVNLNKLQGLVDALEPRTSGFESRIECLWHAAMEALVSLEERRRDDDQHGHIDPRYYSWPENLYEACKKLIRHGAPRYIQSPARSVRSLFGPRVVYRGTHWRGLRRFTTREFTEIDTSLILKTLSPIAKYSPSGMADEFEVSGWRFPDAKPQSDPINLIRLYLGWGTTWNLR